MKSPAAILLVLTLQAATAAAQSVTPPLLSLRAEEDWSLFRDEALRTDAWRKLKYISLGGGSSYLSLGADMRERYEGYTQEGFGSAPPDENGYHQHRFFLHADLHTGGSRIRFFVQVKGAEQFFRPGVPPGANDVDHLDLHQGFIEVKASDRLSVRVGRQELLFGSTRLTGVREGPNVRISFDTVRVILRPDAAWRVDAFAAHPVLTRTGILDDPTESSRSFWGVYAAHYPGPRAKLGFDLYYFGLDRQLGLFHRAAAAGRESRHSVGVRVHRLPAQGVRADFDVEFVAQTGTLGNANNSLPVRAWYAASESGYSFPGVRLRPRLALKLNSASGDGDNPERAMGTFNPLFPDTRDFREQAFPGPANVTLVRPFTELHFGKVTLTTAVDWFCRTSISDGLYSFSTVPYAESRPGSSEAHFVGTKPAVVVQFPVNRHWTITGIAAKLFAGPYVREALSGKSPAYAAIILLLRL